MLKLFLVVLILSVVLYLNRKTPFVKKLWQYLLILFPLSICLLQKAVYKLKKRTRSHTSDRMDTSEIEKESQLDNKIRKLKDQLKKV